jgi:hypothetical protein
MYKKKFEFLIGFKFGICLCNTTAVPGAESSYLLVGLCNLFMPAFDPVRDAVLNSPVESRATSSHSLAVILNDDGDHPSRTSTHILAQAESIRRSSIDLNHISSSSTIPYNPKVRITPPGSVLTPLSQAEIDKYKSFRGQGVSRLTKRKRSASEETDERPVKRLAGDVGVVVEHCKRPLYVPCILLFILSLQTTHGQMWELSNDSNHPSLVLKTLTTG